MHLSICAQSCSCEILHCHGADDCLSYKLADMSFFYHLQPSMPGQSPSLSKKSEAPLELTPLEKMLQNAGPIGSDGRDKFFGMENVQTFKTS